MLSPPSSVRHGRFILCLPLQVTADCEAAVIASPEESSFRSDENASCFFERAARKVIWDKRPPWELGVFSLPWPPSHPSFLFWTTDLAQNKMGGDCIFWEAIPECDSLLWSLVKAMFLFCFCFSWNPFSWSHLLQDLTPQSDIMLSI